MKFWLVGLSALIVALAACTDASVHIGGGGDPNPNPSNADDAYADQYDRYMIRNRKLVEALYESGMNGPNYVLARGWAKDVVDALSTMQKMLQEPHASELGPILESYRNVYDHVQRNRSVATRQQLDRWSVEVRRFAPDKVTIKPESLQEVKALQPQDPNPKPVTPQQPKPVMPAPVTPTNPPPTTNGHATPDFVTYWAWERLHAELEAKWMNGEDAKLTFERLMDVMKLMQNNVPKERLSRMITYTDYYQKLHEDTKGFKEVPPRATKQNVLDDLKAVSSGMKLYFNPDKK
jgi:hypothetical protein